MNPRIKHGKKSARGYSSCRLEFVLVFKGSEIVLVLDQGCLAILSAKASCLLIKILHVSALSLRFAGHHPITSQRSVHHTPFIML